MASPTDALSTTETGAPVVTDLAADLVSPADAERASDERGFTVGDGATAPEAVPEDQVQHGLAPHSHGGPAGERTGSPALSRAQRPTSYRVEDFTVPTGREEEWRFTPLGALAPLLQPAGAAAQRLRAEVSAADGVTHTVRAAEQHPAYVPGDRAAAVAWADAGDEVDHVRIAPEADLAEPVTVALRAPGERAVGHLVVEAGHHSRATVVVDHTGGGAATTGVEVRVGDGAQLTLVSVQQWDDGAVHLSQQDALVGRDATYRHVAVTLGGALVRLGATVRYAGPGGDATLLGVYFADSGQHLEHRSFVDHQAPSCRSNVTYKGALQGASARTVWVGDVLIGEGATGTDTYELNRNLVLTDGARADSVPNLEIETGEIVGAGHASATGRFDDEALFYLQSRGIPADVARRMVVRAFFYEVLQQIGVPEVTERLAAAIDAELEGAAAPSVAPPVGDSVGAMA
ncbi:MAG: Iron-sulfur cluster assembly protein SufD [uncultured Quadrisphaera sp.]|uniref:Iron-sulfur cluster assembly protein SufD n=1 Tax=uncultured Quadrisphaera sp. TaxID=904978 RepID=A0A6J4Q1M1_9ACTN|nr:MAG: Iron-sulfur cluster assembly protein SufD [uncultured Quadrisphaera sp.]